MAIPCLREGLQGALSEHLSSPKGAAHTVAAAAAAAAAGDSERPAKRGRLDAGTPPDARLSYESNDTFDAFAAAEAHSGRPRKPSQPEAAWGSLPPQVPPSGGMPELTFRETYTPVHTHPEGGVGFPAGVLPAAAGLVGYGHPPPPEFAGWALAPVSPAMGGAAPPPVAAPVSQSLKESRAGIDAVRRIPEMSRLDEQIDAINAAKTKRSSKFRGVTRHRRSGRWEAHIWVKETGKQVYLGGYDEEDHAAEAYDVAALKCKGKTIKTNFPIEKYSELLGYMDNISLEELVMAVRRQSQGFARGSSRYRGVTRHPGQNGRWEARIGTPGSKHVYLGLYTDEAEAAKAYDRALVKQRGPQAATNFSMSEYKAELREYHVRQQRELKLKAQKESKKAAARAQGKGGKRRSGADTLTVDPDPLLFLQQASTKLP